MYVCLDLYVILLMPSFIKCFLFLPEEPPFELFCLSQNLCNRTYPVLEKSFLEDQLQPCCLECSCSHDCADYGNCCPDIGDVKPPAWPLDCILPVINADDSISFSDEMYLYSPIQRYNVIASCPFAASDSELVFKCEKKVPDFFEDLVVVADAQGHLFKNKFCAICNGILDYTFWRLRITGCSLEDALKFSPDHDTFEKFKQCMFWSEPRNATQFKNSHCFRAIDKCNVTGALSELPSNAHLCGEYTMYYVHNVGFRNEVYKNPHCWLCNVPDLPIEPFCEITDDSFQFGINFGLTAVLSIHDMALDIIQFQCAMIEVFDPFFNQCRELNCPPLYLPLHGQCVEQFEEMQGVSFGTTLIVSGILPQHRTIQTDDPFSQRAIIYRQIESVLSIDSHKCRRCQLNEWGSRNQNHISFAFQVVYESTKDCDVSFLLDAFKKADGLSISVVSSSDKLYLTLRSRLNDPFPDGHDFELLPESALLARDYCEQPLIDFAEQFCPSIELTEEEIGELRKTFVNVRNPVIKAAPRNDMKFVYCWGDYLEMVNTTGSLSVFKQMFITALMVCLFGFRFYIFVV